MSPDGWAAIVVIAIAAAWSLMRWWTWNRWRERIVHRLNRLIELQETDELPCTQSTDGTSSQPEGQSDE